jgi:hypothetical protein
MIAGTALLILLAAGEPSGPALARGTRAELEECAERIEVLKAHHSDGAELQRLLRRAQELAAQLERANAASADQVPAAAAPSPDELRERADAARDEADRLSAEIAAIDVRLEDARRAEPGDGMQRAAIASVPVVSGDAKLRALRHERAVLAARRAGALAEATRLEAEARDAEREP